MRLPPVPRLPDSRADRLALLLGALALGAGALLRVIWLLAERPGLMGSRDTGAYLQAARTPELFYDPLRSAGYAWFLKAVHLVSDKLPATVALQHLLGLIAGGLLALVVRRAGAPLLVALVPAVVLWLGGGPVLLEHAVLTEGLFTFLVVTALFAASRAQGEERRRLAWALACGVLLGLAAYTRQVALFLVPVVAAWLLLGSGGPLATRFLRAATTAAVAGVLVLTYLGLHAQHARTFAFTQTGNWNAYGRIATFVDCREFTPPKGTERLCIKQPVAKRMGTVWWIFALQSPVNSVYGYNFVAPPDPRAGRKIGEFVRATVLHQPGDYAAAVGTGLWHYVRPSTNDASGHGSRPNELVDELDNRSVVPSALSFVAPYYYPSVEVRHPRVVAALKSYSKLTSLAGLPLVLLVLVAAGGVAFGRGRTRSPATLFAAASLTLIVVPVLTVVDDWRFVIPALGPLATAAALGGWALAERRRAAFRGPVGARSVSRTRGVGTRRRIPGLSG